MKVTIIDANDELLSLLNNNYVEGNAHNYQYVYTKKFIDWYLDIYPSCAMGIYDGTKLIAMITGRIVPTNLTNKNDAQYNDMNGNINLAEISFMCVHKDYRNKKICPLLIASIKNKMIEMGAHDAIFSTHHDMGTSMCEMNHMIRVINIRKLVSTGYLRCDTNIEKLEYYYRIEPVKIKNKILQKITENNINDAFNIYNKWYQQMNIYTNYTLDVFTKVILSNNIVGYLLYDKDIPVDMITYYIISSKVTRKNILMNDAYIYHYTNNANSMHRMISLLLHNEKNNIDTIMMPTTMGIDIIDFEDLKFVPTTSNYNYFLYKNKEIIIQKNKMGILLI